MKQKPLPIRIRTIRTHRQNKEVPAQNLIDDLYNNYGTRSQRLNRTEPRPITERKYHKKAPFGARKK